MQPNLLFDFDGTLADTAPGIVATLSETFLQMGLPVPSRQDMVATIGLPLWRSFQQLGHFSEAEAQEAVVIYKRLFMSCEVPRISMFDGIREALEQLSLRGIKMGIVTSRESHSLQLILQNNGIRHHFSALASLSGIILGRGDDTTVHPSSFQPKPAPDMVLTMLDVMHLRADETIVIGDTTYDIEMGNRAGCRTCAVTWGNHSLETLQTSHPDIIIHEVSELSQLL